MANQTVYPYGTDGQLPSSIGLINDLSTGGVDKALTAEMGKQLKTDFDNLQGTVGEEQTVDLSSLTRITYTITSSGTWTSSGARCVCIDLRNVLQVKIALSGGNGVIAFLESLNFGSGTSVDFAPGYSSRISISDGATKTYTINNGMNYLYVAVKNTTGDEYANNYTIKTTSITNTLIHENDVVDGLNSSSTVNPLSANQGRALNVKINDISKSLFSVLYTTDSVYVEYDTGNVASTGTTTLHTSYIDVSGVEKILYSRGKASSTTTKAGMAFYDENKNYISGQRFVLGASESGYVETELSVPNGAYFARFSIWTSNHDGFYVVVPGSAAPYAKQFQDIEKRVGGSLSGKKVSIIGDSISCFGTEAQVRAGNYTSPFWKVLQVDVGQEIQSWVTWLDVYTTIDSTTSRTNKTIGGVTLTPSMIGTLQTFTPVSEDVGKCIGIPRWASSYTTKPWWQVFIENTGALFCSNASWSGSRVAPVPEGGYRHDAFVLSEMYSDYTLGRVKSRDENGDDIIPDIIFIYRGTNDFTANDPSGNETLDTPDMKSFTGITDEHNFTQCYIWSILRLRSLYPKAVIILCTLNVFKKRNYNRFPTNNGSYTIPDYSNKIREIANIMGCGIIEFDKDGITFENCYPTYINDNATEPLHPNTTGHKVMGMKAVSDAKYYLP